MAASQYLPDFLLFSSAGEGFCWGGEGGGRERGGKGKEFYSQVGADHASLGVCVCVCVCFFLFNYF